MNSENTWKGSAREREFVVRFLPIEILNSISEVDKVDGTLSMASKSRLKIFLSEI